MKTNTPLVALGTLYTIGYANVEDVARLFHLMQDEQTLLLDIRYSPRSRWWPGWNRSALTATYGYRYLWDQRLGNVNYQQREQGIHLGDEYRHAVRAAASWICQGTNLILLCACRDTRTCHRSLVAKLIQDAVQELQEEVRVVPGFTCSLTSMQEHGLNTGSEGQG